ncbi:hypothetical protein VB712_18815, partial [Spirulina sp. CCNP1310]|nr:hypothetical protein [Spirulina sp. CCNP1310]
IFTKLFEVAEIARFTPQQVKFYEDSLKYYRDLQNSLDTARQEGIEEGIQQGVRQVAIQGIEQGLSDEILVKLTGLDLATLVELRQNR